MKHIKTIALLALVTMFAACSMLNEPALLAPGGGLAGGSAGTGDVAQVQVSIGGNARTILPDFNRTFSKFVLSAEPAKGNTQDAPPEAEISGDDYYGYISIPYGEWIITITGFVAVNGEDIAVASGSAPLNVQWDYHELQISVNVPETGGKGTFAYTVSVPSGVSAALTLAPIGGETAEVNNTAVESGKLQTSEVASGIYFLTVSAQGAEHTITRNEVVHIYPKLTSSVDYVFTALDFGASSLPFNGTIKVLLDGKQPDSAEINYSTNQSNWNGEWLSFTGTDGSATWTGYLYSDTLRYGSTLYFRVGVYADDVFGYVYQEVPVTISVAQFNDPEQVVDLGTVNVSAPIITSLKADTWTDGTIPGDLGETVIWYSIDDAKVGETYYVWWNDSYQGDGSKTLDVRVAGYDTNGYYLFDQDSGWNSPVTIEPYTNGTISLRVSAYSSGRTGTYAIAYSTDRDWLYGQYNATELSAETWTDGTIPVGLESIYMYYSIDAKAGETYYIWTNQGDGNKTAYWVYINVIDTNGYNIGDGGNAWDYSVSFYAETTGTYYIRLYAYGESNRTGTYAIAYSTDYYWQDAYKHLPYTRPLSANTWLEGTIPSGRDSYEAWYTLNITKGQTYYIWTNNSSEGDGSSNANTYITGRYGNGDVLFSDVQNAWYFPVSFTAETSGTVYVQLRAYQSDWDDLNRVKTFGIAYSATSTWNNASSELLALYKDEKWSEVKIISDSGQGSSRTISFDPFDASAYEAVILQFAETTSIWWFNGEVRDADGRSVGNSNFNNGRTRINFENRIDRSQLAMISYETRSGYNSGPTLIGVYLIPSTSDNAYDPSLLPPAPEPPVLPVVFENGLWASELGAVEVNLDQSTVIIFENGVDVSGYRELVIQTAQQYHPGWIGGQLGNISEEVQYSYWDSSGIYFDNGFLTFDLGKYDITLIDEIVYSVSDGQYPIAVYLVQ